MYEVSVDYADLSMDRVAIRVGDVQITIPGEAAAQVLELLGACLRGATDGMFHVPSDDGHYPNDWFKNSDNGYS